MLFRKLKIHLTGHDLNHSQRSATARCSSRSSLNGHATSRFRSSVTITEISSTCMSVTALSNGVTRRSLRLHRRRTFHQRCVTWWRVTPSNWRDMSATRTPVQSSTSWTKMGSTSSLRWMPDYKWNTRSPKRLQGKMVVLSYDLMNILFMLSILHVLRW